MLSRPAAASVIVLGLSGAAAVFFGLTSEPGLHAGTRLAPVPAASGDYAPTGIVLALSEQESTLALCEIRSAQIKALLGGTSGQDQYQALRDAIPTLNARIHQVQSAASGRPAIRPVLTSVQRLYRDWLAALTSYDSGETAASTRAMRSANTRYSSLNEALKKALPASARCE